jgi:hypothetical protein
MQRGRVGVSRWFCLEACRYYSVHSTMLCKHAVLSAAVP